MDPAVSWNPAVTRPLTERQKLVLDFIRRSILDRGFPPTMREIGRHLGIRSTNGVNDHLRALERKGHLTREDLKSRALKPTVLVEPSPPGSDPPPDAAMGVARISVYAQITSQAFEQTPLVEELRLDVRLVGGSGRTVFGLVVRGDSLANDGIMAGDYVLVRRQASAERQNLVVVLLGEEASIKYYYPEPGHIRLESANRAIAPIYVRMPDVRRLLILGVVIGLYRRVAPPAD